MDGFDTRTSFGTEESRRYDATDTHGDKPETGPAAILITGTRRIRQKRILHSWL
jgi:hypothetical protein